MILRNLIEGTVFSILVFSCISFVTVMLSLLSSEGSADLPVTNIGFPYEYYHQFWLQGSTGLNCGWILPNFVKDVIITWHVSTVFWLFTKAVKSKCYI